MNRKQTLGLCMIVKNEEIDLPRCLESVKGIVDEIVVVDTGSTDKTIDVAKKYGACVSSFEWDDNFSDARNFALSHAKSDWLLLLDADETLDRSYSTELKDLIESTRLDGFDFTICSLPSPSARQGYSVHMALRLLRNNGEYMFSGAIHEQIARMDGQTPIGRFGRSDIKIYHYGYMKEEVDRKNKRKRNLPILKKELEKNPEDGFTLFNIGNEYLAANDPKKALKYYNKVFPHLNYSLAYAPHIIFRMTNCHDRLGESDKAVKVLKHGLMYYPKCTDYVFYAACIRYRRKEYSLAAADFKKCLEMGDPPLMFKFMEGCGTYRPASLLSRLYFELHDYDNSLLYSNKAIALNHGLHQELYRIAESLGHIYDDESIVYKKLMSYFGDPEYEPNAILACDILLSRKMFGYAAADIKRKNKSHKYDVDFKFLEAKLKFLKGDVQTARRLFEEILSDGRSGSVLPGVLPQSARYFFVADAVGGGKNSEYALVLVKRYDGENYFKICAQIDSLLWKRGNRIITDDDGPAPLLTCAGDILDKFLKTSDFNTFELILPVLNYINSKKVLLLLAKTYYENGYADMAVKAILRSLKELDSIDSESACILSRSMA